MAVRIWKGYRDAQCGWTVGHNSSAAAAACGGDTDRNDGNGGNGGGNGAGNDGGNRGINLAAVSSILAIYAPRRGLLELWRVPNGGRLRSFSVATGCRLLSPPPPLAATAEEAEEAAASGAEAGLPRCYLLQPSGTLHRITVGAP